MLARLPLLVTASILGVTIPLLILAVVAQRAVYVLVVAS